MIDPYEEKLEAEIALIEKAQDRCGPGNADESNELSVRRGCFTKALRFYREQPRVDGGGVAEIEQTISELRKPVIDMQKDPPDINYPDGETSMAIVGLSVALAIFRKHEQPGTVGVELRKLQRREFACALSLKGSTLQYWDLEWKSDRRSSNDRRDTTK